MECHSYALVSPSSGLQKQHFQQRSPLSSKMGAGDNEDRGSRGCPCRKGAEGHEESSGNTVVNEKICIRSEETLNDSEHQLFTQYDDNKQNSDTR